jgi:hypothetical protein
MYHILPAIAMFIAICPFAFYDKSEDHNTAKIVTPDTHYGYQARQPGREKLP